MYPTSSNLISMIVIICICIFLLLFFSKFAIVVVRSFVRLLAKKLAPHFRVAVNSVGSN